MKNETMKKYRSFLKDDIRLETDFSRTDQNLGKIVPPIEKPCHSNAKKIDLPSPDSLKTIGEISVKEAIAQRASRRKYLDQPVTLEELSFLLWATQGVRKRTAGAALRTVPSAGCRHAFETYIAVFNVEELPKGIYRYLPLTHQLVQESIPEHLEEKMSEAALGQTFAASAAVTFLWTVIPYRMEWRYAEASYKVLALDAGHVCQNLYLACESIGAGTCAIAAYDQKKADTLLGIDGDDEFVIYMSPVGKNK